MSTHPYTGQSSEDLFYDDVAEPRTFGYDVVQSHPAYQVGRTQPPILRRFVGWLAAHSGPHERVDPLAPDYRYASQVDPDELWRMPGNGGRHQDAGYIQTYADMRRSIVSDFASGELYRTPESFTDALRRMHRTAVASGDYVRLNGDNKLHEWGLTGEFRSTGIMCHERIEDARMVEQIAARLGDPYGSDGHLERGTPNSLADKLVFNLPGIDENYAAYEVVKYGADGTPHGYWRSDNGYLFFYPNSHAMPQYITQMQRLGQQIEIAIKSGRQDDEVLELIAKQYQYGAHARPFLQVNNSLFMQIANAQIKMLGYRGVTHGSLDAVAQRLQPDTFAQYFTQRVRGSQLSQ